MSSCSAESEVDITGVVAAEEEDDEIDAKTTDGWHIFGRECPKEEIVFLCQVIILYTVIVVSIYNLTVAHDDSTALDSFAQQLVGLSTAQPFAETITGVWRPTISISFCPAMRR